MGTKRLKAQAGDRSSGTGSLKSEPKKGTGQLKAGTGPLKPGTGKLKGKTGPLRSGYTTGQLRMPPSKRRKRTSPLKRLLFGSAVAGVVTLAGALGGAFAFFQSLNPELAKRQDTAGAFMAFAGGLVPLAERENVLLLGTDYSYAAGHRMKDGPVRSDTIIVMSADPEHNRVNAISIPRDTRVLIRGHYDKINAAMAYGGPELTAQVCSELLGGVPIHRWVQVNTAGLEQVVDAMGGVSLTVEKDMRYVDHTAHLDIDIRKGTQTLTGTQAHQFVRFRHDELGDIGRVQRQQQFLRAVAGQLLRPDTLPKLPTLLATVQKNLSTNMSGTEMLRLGLFAPRLSRERIQMVMLPGAFSAGKFAASYWLVSPDAASALGHRLLAGQGAEALAAGEARGKLKLTVLNGTPHEGVASAAALVLRADGWNVWSVGDAPQRDCARTRVIAQTGYDQLTGELAKPLGVSPENVAASVGDLTTDFTVVVGEDFAAKHATADTASRP